MSNSDNHDALAGNAQRLNTASNLNRIAKSAGEPIPTSAREGLSFHNNTLADEKFSARVNNVGEAIDKGALTTSDKDSAAYRSLHNGVVMENDDGWTATTYLDDDLIELDAADQHALLEARKRKLGDND